MTDSQLELPGLEPPSRQETAMVTATRRTIAALHEQGKLRPDHALLTQLALSLADAVDRGARSGRASAVAMASKELRETLLQLDPPPEGESGGDAADKLAALMGRLDELAAAGTTTLVAVS